MSKMFELVTFLPITPRQAIDGIAVILLWDVEL